jgi:hypothetical protein
MTDTDTTDRLMTTRDYARYRRCSGRTIEREREHGTGCPYIRIGARIIYRLSDIDRHLDAHRIGSRGTAGDPAGTAGAPPADGASPSSCGATPARRRGRLRRDRATTS